MGDLDRREDALTAIEEATNLYRALAAAGPDALHPRPGHVTEQSVERAGRPGPPPGRPERHRRSRHPAPGAGRHPPRRLHPALAAALQTYGIVLTELGRNQDALAAEQESVNLYRQLYKDHPDRYRDALATALHNLAIHLRTLGNDADAEHVERERATLND